MRRSFLDAIPVEEPVFDNFIDELKFLRNKGLLEVEALAKKEQIDIEAAKQERLQFIKSVLQSYKEALKSAAYELNTEYFFDCKELSFKSSFFQFESEYYFDREELSQILSTLINYLQKEKLSFTRVGDYGINVTLPT